MFDLNKCEKNSQGHWIAQTHNGLTVRILCNDAKGAYPLVGIINRSDMDDEATTWTTDGKSLVARKDHPYDLINPPKRHKLERWANVYSDGSIFLHQQRTSQIRGVQPIAMVPITLDFIEGEGLEKDGAK